jgi:hypothetical protein
MAITYTWKVLELTAYPTYESQSDVVFKVMWQYLGKDDQGNGSSRGGATEVTYNAGAPFTPYADLTEEQVLGWVEPLISDEKKAEMAAEIAGDIQWSIDQQSADNPVTPPLPWPMTMPAAAE